MNMYTIVDLQKTFKMYSLSTAKITFCARHFHGKLMTLAIFHLSPVFSSRRLFPLGIDVSGSIEITCNRLQYDNAMIHYTVFATLFLLFFSEYLSSASLFFLPLQPEGRQISCTPNIPTCLHTNPCLHGPQTGCTVPPI